MRLLFDHNLSPALVRLLSDRFPGSTHTHWLGFDRTDDREIRAYAIANDCVVVTKDSDFADAVRERGFPPKVIWVRLGNGPTSEVEQALRRAYDRLLAFELDPAAGVIEIG